MTMDPQDLKEAPLSELLSRLQADLVALVDSEKKLALAEVTAKWNEAKKHGSVLFFALYLSHLGGICLAASAVLALSVTLEPWLAALIIGGALLACSGIAFLKLKTAMENFTLMPGQAIDSVKQDKEAMGEVIR